MFKKFLILFYFLVFSCKSGDSLVGEVDISLLSEGIEQSGDVCINFKTKNENIKVVYAKINVIDSHRIVVHISKYKLGADYIALRSDEYFSLRIKWPADSNYVDINFCGSELGRWTKGKGIALKDALSGGQQAEGGSE